MKAVRGPFDEAPDRSLTRFVPAATVMAGSSLTLWPVIASFPFLPPVGLLTLLSWRLARPERVRIWTPLPLGLYDDLVSGQPLGCAMLLWTACFFAVDLLDQRLVFRDFWQDWLIAGAAIGFCAIAGRLVTTPLGAHVETVLLLQIVVTIMLFPFATRLCAILDRVEDEA